MGLAAVTARRKRQRAAPAGPVRANAGPAHRPLPHPARSAGAGRATAGRPAPPSEHRRGSAAQPQAGAGQRRQPVVHPHPAQLRRLGRGRQQLALGHQQRGAGLQLSPLCAAGAGPGARQLLRHWRHHRGAGLLPVAGHSRREWSHAGAGGHQDCLAGAGARMAANARHRARIRRARRGVSGQPGCLALPPAATAERRRTPRIECHPAIRQPTTAPPGNAGGRPHGQRWSAGTRGIQP